MAEQITDPFGCRHCGVPERPHFQRWEESAGWHGWVQPTPDQIKERMLARRNHKQEGTA